MTQIEFYILATDSDEAWLRAACRITDKATQHKRRVFLNMGSQIEAKKLDELLWTFSQGSFIPHRIVDNVVEDGVEPVLIGYTPQASGPHWELMINLAPEVPEAFSRYERVAEIVDANPARREKGRERYRYYRDRGYELKTHHI